MAKKKDKKDKVILGNLCTNCAYRFRRMFWTKDLDRYDLSNVSLTPVDEEELPEGVSPDNQLAIMVICLRSDVDIESDLTIDCSHYEPKKQDELKTDENNKLLDDLDNYKRK